MENYRYLYKAKVSQDVPGEVKKGGWVEGSYVNFLPYQPGAWCTPETLAEDEKNTKHYIVKGSFADWGMAREMLMIEVDPTTLCQCTGIRVPFEPVKLNRNGEPFTTFLWENDTVEVGGEEGVVRWDEDLCAFVIKDIKDETKTISIVSDIADIVHTGNVFNNVEEV